jgi:ABC-type oligopeptide transport system substrate-binding subunit
VEKYIPNGKITIDLTTYTAMLAKIGQQDAGWGVYTGGWVHELSPIAMFSVSLISKGARNFTAFSDPKQDALIEQASAEFDEAKRTSLLKDAQNLALQNWSHIPTHHGQFTALIHPSVRNLDVGSAAGPSYYVRYAWLKA